MPLLRADLGLVDTYVYYEQVPLHLPITTLGGLNDPEVSPKQLIAWQAQTSSDFNQQLFPGGHFFIQQQQSLILNLILTKLFRYPFP